MTHRPDLYGITDDHSLEQETADKQSTSKIADGARQIDLIDMDSTLAVHKNFPIDLQNVFTSNQSANPTKEPVRMFHSGHTTWRRRKTEKLGQSGATYDSKGTASDYTEPDEAPGEEQALSLVRKISALEHLRSESYVNQITDKLETMTILEDEDRL